MKEGMSSFESLEDLTAALSWHFWSDLTVELLIFEGGFNLFRYGKFDMLWDNRVFSLRADFLNFYLDQNKANGLISWIYVSADMFNTLKGLAMASKPAILL